MEPIYANDPQAYIKLSAALSRTPVSPFFLQNLTKAMNTDLMPLREAMFRRKFPDPMANYDYDMRAGYGTQGANTHFDDVGKKPNHPTFSDQSRFVFPDNQRPEMAPGRGRDSVAYNPATVAFEHPGRWVGEPRSDTDMTGSMYLPSNERLADPEYTDYMEHEYWPRAETTGAALILPKMNRVGE